MEPVKDDTTADRRTAVELAKRLLVDSIWRTAKIEVDGVTFPDTQEIFDGRAPEGMSVDDIVTVNNIKRAWRLACISRFTLCVIWFTLTPIRRTMASTQPMISRGVGPRPSHVLSWVSRESEEPYE